MRLGLAEAPLRIECFDVSHVQGTNVVASMVVFEDGLPRKSEYRRFAMRAGGGDTDWIAEAVRRRFARYLDAQVAVGALDAAAPDAGGRGPGGSTRDRPAAQVRLPAESRRGRRRCVRKSPRRSRARRLWRRRRRADRPGQAAGRGMAAEGAVPGHPALAAPRGCICCNGSVTKAHRFAITFHRQRRSKAMTISVLDGIPGLGDTQTQGPCRAVRLAQAAADGLDGRLARRFLASGRRLPRRSRPHSPPTARAGSRPSMSRPERC